VPSRGILSVFLPAVIACSLANTLWANPVLVPSFPNYTLLPLGSISGISANFQYNGLAFNGSQLLLSGGDDSTAGFQSIYSVPVVRNANQQVTGLQAATPYASVESYPLNFFGNFLAGGLVYAPNGTLLYTTDSVSFIGQYSPASTTSSLTTAGGIPLGGLGYLPNGQLVLTATNGNCYPVSLSGAGANGIYANVVIGAALAGVNAPADSFADLSDGVLVGDSSTHSIMMYGLDASGHPTGVGAQVVTDSLNPIGFGLVRDPQHPQSYFFTTGNNQLWELTVPTPEPRAGLLAMGGIVLILSIRHIAERRKRLS
jgi:hypothetical protein